jgi:hypothetical protein
MTTHIRTWDQSKFILPGRKFQSYKDEGEFDDISGLYPDRRNECLRRGPGWSSHVPWPTAAGTFEGFSHCNAVVLDADENSFVFLGKLTTPANHLASVHWSRDSKALVDKYDMTTDLGASYPSMGHHQRDVLYLGGKLYIISASYDIYWGANLSSQPADNQAGTFGIVCPYGDKVFLADSTQGVIHRLNAAGTSFDVYYTPRTYLQTLAIFPYREFLCVIGRLADGVLGVYRIPDVFIQTSHQIGVIPDATARYASGTARSAGSPFAQIGEYVYMLTGYLNPIETGLMQLYSFDGAHIRYVGDLDGIPARSSCRALGLLPWHGRLCCFALASSGTAHYLKMLQRDRFIDFAPLSGTLVTLSAVYEVGGDLVLIAEDGAGNEGFYYTEGLSDGWVTTTYLDMGQPGRLKTLHSITAHMSDQADDFFVKLYYRVDDTAAWTQAGTTQEQTIRPTAEDLDTEFYVLQIKVELDDDTGNDEDIAIEKISVTYSADLA